MRESQRPAGEREREQEQEQERTDVLLEERSATLVMVSPLDLVDHVQTCCDGGGWRRG
jgi:hypothetical protein